MEWENDICYTLRDGSISAYTTNQSEARWVYDIIRTDESERADINEWKFETETMLKYDWILAGVRYNI